MSYRRVARLPQAPPVPAPRHDRIEPGALSGRLELELVVVSTEGLHPGTGRWVLHGERELVEGGNSLRGAPSVPGTGVKGAVRTAFELLSGGCPVTEKMERCRLGRLCPACALFGAMGHAGHVGFSEFVASADTSYEVTRAADGWPGKSQSDDYRVYDGRPATGLEGQPMPRRQAVEAMPVDTQLTGSCWFRSVPSEQLGRLLLAAGLGEGSRRVSLRLGGKKFDGFGEVRAKCLRVRLHEGPLKRRTLAGAEVAAWLRERVDAAVSETPGIDGVLEALKNG